MQPRKRVRTRTGVSPNGPEENGFQSLTYVNKASSHQKHKDDDSMTRAPGQSPRESPSETQRQQRRIALMEEYVAFEDNTATKDLMAIGGPDTEEDIPKLIRDAVASTPDRRKQLKWYRSKRRASERYWKWTPELPRGEPAYLKKDDLSRKVLLHETDKIFPRLDPEELRHYVKYISHFERGAVL